LEGQEGQQEGVEAVAEQQQHVPVQPQSPLVET
jgi:hypothetical protein